MSVMDVRVIPWWRKNISLKNCVQIILLSFIGETYLIVQKYHSRLVMLLQDWSHHYISFVVAIMNSWIVTMYQSALWKLICASCHSFPFLFRLPRTWIMSNSAGVSGKPRTLTLPVHLVHGPIFWWSHSYSNAFVTLYVLF